MSCQQRLADSISLHDGSPEDLLRTDREAGTEEPANITPALLISAEIPDDSPNNSPMAHTHPDALLGVRLKHC